jgi:F420-dependent oxidoreductase-like protein
VRLRVLLEPRQGASYPQILAMAQAAEESGFDAFFRSDHYMGIDATDPTYAPTDSWTTLAGLAVQTSRVQLGTLMTASTFRHPSQLAIAVATVDAMSGGRAELGIGAAWYEREHQGLGIPFPSTSERFDRLEEQLAILAGLWTTPTGQYFSYRGKHYHLDECSNFPVHAPARADGTAPGAGAPGFPPHRPRPRVIIGGAGRKRTPSLAARFADEFNSGMSDGIAERFANFHRICSEVGRDPATVRLSTTLPVCCGTTRAQAQRRADDLGAPGARMLQLGIVGTPRDIAARVEELAKAGTDTIYFHIYNPADPDHIRLLGTELIPLLS